MLDIAFNTLVMLSLVSGPTGASAAEVPQVLSQDSHPSAALPSISRVTRDDCVSCYHCEDPNAHRVDTDGENWDRGYGETFHTCSSVYAEGTCQDRHPESENCAGSGGGTLAVDLEEVERELTEAMWSQFHITPSAWFTSWGTGVVVNHARRAVQVLGCDGKVTLSIPIPPHMAQAFVHASP